MTDTAFEQQAVRSTKGAGAGASAGYQPQKTHEASTGFTSQCADLSVMHTMEQAMQDKLNQTMKKGMEDGYNARMEEDEEDRAKNVTAEVMDAAEDGGKVDDDDLEVLRQRRKQMMKDMHEKKQKYLALGHGEYSEIPEEDFLTTVTKSERAIVHFYHKSFENCKIMDMHLSKMSKKFMGTRFVKMDSEKSPFFVEKLAIKTLPCAVVFNDFGVAKGKQLGFDGLPGQEFETVELAWRLAAFGGMEEDFGPEDYDLFNN